MRPVVASTRCSVLTTTPNRLMIRTVSIRFKLVRANAMLSHCAVSDSERTQPAAIFLAKSIRPVMKLFPEIDRDPLWALRLDDVAILHIDKVLSPEHIRFREFRTKVSRRADANDAVDVVEWLRGEVGAEALVAANRLVAARLGHFDALREVRDERPHHPVAVPGMHRHISWIAVRLKHRDLGTAEAVLVDEHLIVVDAVWARLNSIDVRVHPWKVCDVGEVLDLAKPA